MKIKDFKCKCGHDDFFFSDNGKQTGIYCSYCGKWLKWANKDEKNLRMLNNKKEVDRDRLLEDLKNYRPEIRPLESEEH